MKIKKKVPYISAKNKILLRLSKFQLYSSKNESWTNSLDPPSSSFTLNNSFSMKTMNTYKSQTHIHFGYYMSVSSFTTIRSISKICFSGLSNPPSSCHSCTFTRKTFFLLLAMYIYKFLTVKKVSKHEDFHSLST